MPFTLEPLTKLPSLARWLSRKEVFALPSPATAGLQSYPHALPEPRIWAFLSSLLPIPPLPLSSLVSPARCQNSHVVVT